MMLETSHRRMTEQLVKQWEQAFDLMWGNHQGITLAQRLEALGSDAAELFGANTALITYIATILTGNDDTLLTHIMAKAATMPPATASPSGRTPRIASPSRHPRSWCSSRVSFFLTLRRR
jgi:hypothetical protein